VKQAEDEKTASGNEFRIKIKIHNEKELRQSGKKIIPALRTIFSITIFRNRY